MAVVAQAYDFVVGIDTHSKTRIGRKRGKSDSIDAGRAARAVLGIETNELREPRAGQHHTALRVLTVARTSMVRERTAAINSLIALLRVVDLGIDLRKSLTPKTIGTIGAWRTRDEGVGTRVSRSEATRLAKQILALEDQLEQNRADMTLLVLETNQALLDMPGVGPISAAAILTAWSHPGRVRSEAALAALAGTCPIPASSGGTTRYRLNRGGDRQLNKAIHTIAVVRMRWHQETREYVVRRTREGRNKKEIIRSLKRYITRQILEHSVLLARCSAVTRPPSPLTKTFARSNRSLSDRHPPGGYDSAASRRAWL